MLTSILTASALATLQSSKTTVEAGSVYGAHTYSAYSEFVMELGSLVVIFAPEELAGMTFQIMKDGKAFSNPAALLPTYTSYENFLYAQPEGLEKFVTKEPGSYSFIFKTQDKIVGDYPFQLTKVPVDDEFNPTQQWDIATPVDNMGYLSFSSTGDSQVMLTLWLASTRESLPEKAGLHLKVYLDGNLVSHATHNLWQGKHNQAVTFPLITDAKARTSWTKSDLGKLNGTLSAVLSVEEKAIRTFEWKVNDGVITPHRRSLKEAASTDQYLVPRTLIQAHGDRFVPRLDEVYWAESK